VNGIFPGEADRDTDATSTTGILRTLHRIPAHRTPVCLPSPRPSSRDIIGRSSARTSDIRVDEGRRRSSGIEIRIASTSLMHGERKYARTNRATSVRTPLIGYEGIIWWLCYPRLPPRVHRLAAAHARTHTGEPIHAHIHAIIYMYDTSRDDVCRHTYTMCHEIHTKWQAERLVYTSELTNEF